MLDYRRMDNRSFTTTALAGLTFLLIIPTSSTNAANLREEAVSYRMQGYELQQQGDANGALAFYQKAAELDPRFPTPYNDAGVVLEQLQRPEEAQRSYERALTIDPNYVEAHANLALLFERMGKQDQAIAHWQKRYELGEPNEAWTLRAKERLIALGVLEPHGLIGPRPQVVDHAFSSHANSLKEFESVTERHGNWP